jgi:hybrid polyketide synthase / nonribosomal peptide synthetase ACE1
VANDRDSLLQQSTITLGIDSLVAVEIRSWMLRELTVDIPVLKILGEASIQDIVDFAVENLPETLTPNKDLNAEDAITTEVLAEPSIEELRPDINPTVDSPITASTPSHSTTKSESDSSSARDSWKSQDTPSKSSIPSSVSSSPVITQKLATDNINAQSPIIDKVLPMSFGQSRFWVMSQIVQDSSSFNVTCDIELAAEVDVPALANAVRSLGARHEALRTCFFNEDNHQPMQGILKESSLHLETIEAPSSDVERYLDELHKTEYDLSKGEIMRIILVSNAQALHRLLVGYHHINMDSSSLSVLVYDLQRLYAGQKLPPPRVQYSDFALHQLERLRNGHWDSQISYWRSEFSTLPDPLPILNISPNTHRARPVLTTYENLIAKTRITSKVGRLVQSLSRKAAVTPFHLYATVFHILLARLCATDDISIGMADANRSEVGAVDSIGNFLNLLPLRFKTAHDQRFSSLLKLTKAKVLNALSNSSIPFDVILEEVGVQRNSTHSPLFQAFIDYRNVTEKLPWGKGYIEGKRYILSKTPYDVMLDIIDTPTGEASLEIMVQGALYTREEAEIILRSYTNLLNAFTENIELTAGEVNIFDKSEVDHALRLGQGKVHNHRYLSALSLTTKQGRSWILEMTASWLSLIQLPRDSRLRLPCRTA